MNKPEQLPSSDTLIATILYLMSRYADKSCPKLALIIEQHLKWLAQSVEGDSALLKSTCQKLENQWRRYAQKSPLANRANRHFVEEEKNRVAVDGVERYRRVH